MKGYAFDKKYIKVNLYPFEVRIHCLLSVSLFISSQTNVRMETMVCAKQMNGNANLSINVCPDHSTVMAKTIVKMGPMRLDVVSYSLLKN